MNNIKQSYTKNEYDVTMEVSQSILSDFNQFSANRSQKLYKIIQSDTISKCADLTEVFASEEEILAQILHFPNLLCIFSSSAANIPAKLLKLAHWEIVCFINSINLQLIR